VSGALAERDFVLKLEKAGFSDVRVVDRRPVTLDELAASPLFTDDLVALMRTLIPPAKQAEVATAAVFKASLVSSRPDRPGDASLS
jgi:hypothetical protein